MTAAQKTAKAKFKQAIAYRQKTGVSLKEAFAHIYGRKVGAVKKSNNSTNIKIASNVGNIESSVSNILGIKIGIKKLDNRDGIALMLYDISNKKNIITINFYDTTNDIINDIAPKLSYYIFQNTNEKGFTDKEKKIIDKKISNYCKGLLSEVKRLNKSIKKPIAKKVVMKKLAPKKNVAKKVVRKIVKKKAAPKKKVAKKKLTRKDYDKRFQADKPGKRTSASGNTYYEYRENRVDYGKLLGIKKYDYQQLENIRLTRINNDVNGNPRYVVHFYELLNDEENIFLPFSKKYEYALKKAKKIGGRKFHNKQYGGGIVFQSYNTDNLKEQIIDVMETTPKIKY